MRYGIFAILLLFLLCFTGCWHSLYKIKIDDIEDLQSSIVETERLIKKIEVLPNYTYYTYPIFRFEDGGITMAYTTTNYDSNDSIREGRSNPNQQKSVDTCYTVPKLSHEEWILLKKELRKLENFDIRGNDIAFYNDTVLEFFCYKYLYPDNWEYRDIGYLALLSENIINSEDFKQKFEIMDKKDGLYLIKKIR